MSTSTYDVLDLVGFEQGTIGQIYDEEKDNRIRSIGYIPMTSIPISVILEATASTSKQVSVAFRGYSDTTPESVVCNLYWYDSPYTFDVSSYSNIKYFRIVLKYSDNSDITPSELSSCVLTSNEQPLWTVEQGILTHETLPEELTSLFTPPYPNNYWFVEDGKLKTNALPAELTSIFSAPYPPGYWYVEDDILKHDKLPDELHMGCFLNCGQLTVEMPVGLVDISEETFLGTHATIIRY